MNTPTQEQLEQIRTLRKLVEHIEAGGSVEMNIGSRANPKWTMCGLNSFIDQTTWYRAKPTPKQAPRYYTVNELIKEGARYLCAGTEVYTIICLSAKSGELTIIISKLENHYPIWFHQHNFTWSADGREWKSFVKES